MDDRCSPDDLRREGWTVAVHNDYRLSGQLCTFWMMTKVLPMLDYQLIPIE